MELPRVWVAFPITCPAAAGLIDLRATHRLADVLRELKAVSSGWVHNEIGMRRFAWQALAQHQKMTWSPLQKYASRIKRQSHLLF
jgi:hypothetical protein